ncbi:hypothetical protein ACFQ1E_16885 [Sphingomonas canadensis]|uniref:Hemerythrin-like domain-containing protein n=1 Tax=Sphingomonas canadensis TaxID=1219257 RepID=A0ABW3HEC2_9SPHN|nr:hypothetical protein [Sphingomonas canadensis]MCW3837722.1 hypothetical protein [Sphingomonas canadensis]
MVALTLALLAAIVRIAQTLAGLRDRLPGQQKRDPEKLLRMLCEQVGRHTDHMHRVFAQRLRQPQPDVPALRLLLPHMREDLAPPMFFVAQMRGLSPEDWPSPALLQAFGEWSGQIAAMAGQIGDLHQAVTFPLVREPVDKAADARMAHQYLIERAFLDRGVDTLRQCAFDFCKAACDHLEKLREGKPDKDGQKPPCPCCETRDALSNLPVRDPLDAVVIVVKEEAKPAPAPAPAPTPAPAACCCTAPRMCGCMRGCACRCGCQPPAKG